MLTESGSNPTILSYVGKGQFFAETYSILKDEPLLIDVVANEDSEILFLNIGNVIGNPDRPGTLQTKFLMNRRHRRNSTYDCSTVSQVYERQCQRENNKAPITSKRG